MIPTHFCRNACGYCAFVEHAGERARLITLGAAADEMRRAAHCGATELLIMSGEGVESSAQVRETLAAEDCRSYLDYLIEVARLALDFDLLPHINVGNLREEEFAALKPYVPSMGMMVESVNAALRRTVAHRRAPDKEPERRFATLRCAGRARMPFTTGILVGIGETDDDRLAALRLIAEIHAQFGHIQEVIVQPLVPHPGTAMENACAPSNEIMCATVRAAREILPPEVAVQIPPNIAANYLELIECGASDLGGVSPDGDRINPGQPWRQAREYAFALRSSGRSLVPRLAVHDRYLTPTWLGEDLLHAAHRVRLKQSDFVRD